MCGRPSRSSVSRTSPLRWRSTSTGWVSPMKPGNGPQGVASVGAGWNWGDAALMLQEYWRNGRPDGAPGGTLGQGVSVCFMCADALAIYREVSSRGIRASGPFVGNGLWDLALQDPDGYRIPLREPHGCARRHRLHRLAPSSRSVRTGTLSTARRSGNAIAVGCGHDGSGILGHSVIGNAADAAAAAARAVA